MVTYSHILAGRIPWIEELGRLHSPQGHKESDTTEVTWHTVKTQTQRTDLRTQCQGLEGEDGTNGENSMETYTVAQTASKIDSHGNLLYDSGSSTQGSVTTQRGGMVWEVGGRLKREGTYVYLGLIHVYVWQKSTQYCNYPSIKNKLRKKSMCVWIDMCLL